MSEHSAIEWTDATWNPVTGCTKVSPGCTFCYAERFAERFRGVPGHPYKQGFDLKLWPDRLRLPLLWKKPRCVFVNSMSDMFHKDVPDEFVRRVFETMIKGEQHIFQVLTKRSEQMMTWCRLNFSRNGDGGIILPPHVWLGVSVENQNYIWRIRHLQRTPARIRFISFEPLLGPVKLNASLLRNIHWVIVGGESGPRSRPMKSEWVSDIRDQCKKHGVPFFFKQWGAYNPIGQHVGKHAAGRILDGKFWNEMPVVQKPVQLALV